MAKVYVLNNRHHSFENASNFGELVFVTEGVVPVFKTDYVGKLLSDKLKYFNVDEDYLLPTGPTILGMMATTMLSKGNEVKFLKILIFDAKAQSYVVRHLPI